MIATLQAKSLKPNKVNALRELLNHLDLAIYEFSISLDETVLFYDFYHELKLWKI